MTTEPKLHDERMSRVDGCPRCVISYQTPIRVRPTANGFRADYTCGNCRHEWTTTWGDR